MGVEVKLLNKYVFIFDWNLSKIIIYSISQGAPNWHFPAIMWRVCHSFQSIPANNLSVR